MSFSDFLGAITADQSYVAAAVGVLLSVVADYVPSYVNLEARWKALVFWGLCVAIPLIGVFVGGLFGVFVEPTFIDNYWPALVVGVVAGGGGTLFHTKVATVAKSKIQKAK